MSDCGNQMSVNYCGQNIALTYRLIIDRHVMERFAGPGVDEILTGAVRPRVTWLTVSEPQTRPLSDVDWFCGNRR